MSQLLVGISQVQQMFIPFDRDMPPENKQYVAKALRPVHYVLLFFSGCVYLSVPTGINTSGQRLRGMPKACLSPYTCRALCRRG